MLLMVTGLASAQDPSSSSPQNDSLAASVRDLQAQVKELRAAIADIRAESAQYRAETAQLRKELETAREQSASAAPPTGTSTSSSAGVNPVTAESSTTAPEAKPSLAARVASLEESTGLLNGKVDDQYQTKIDSGSKYRLRLSGIALLNLFSNRGMVNNQDVPTYVPEPTPWDPHGTFGATMRQSEFGLEAFGPKLLGAKTSGKIQVDFSGGLPNTSNGVNYGVVRLRTADMRLDWDRTSIVAGQDSLFFSPLSPTSFASLAVPAFGYSGNLWGWIPQVRVEHRFSLTENQDVTIQAGILDNVTGEPPFGLFDRIPQAGEQSSQPAFATRVAWSGRVFGQPIQFGAAGYYSRQNWYYNRHVDGWSGMADWDIPIAPMLSLSGEFYRGLAIGGLGGSLGRSVLLNGDPLDPATQIRALDSTGGWSQLKLKINSRFEMNGAFGLDSPMADDIGAFAVGQSYIDPKLSQNRSTMANFIYRPRSNLLFSAEYRHMRTSVIYAGNQSAEQVNLMMGILF